MKNKWRNKNNMFPMLLVVLMLGTIGCKSTDTMTKSDDMMAEEAAPMAQEMITALPVPAAAYGTYAIDPENI